MSTLESILIVGLSTPTNPTISLFFISGAAIGSNVFITNSVEPGARVSIKNQELHIKMGQKSVVEKCNLEQEEPWETDDCKA